MEDESKLAKKYTTPVPNKALLIFYLQGWDQNNIRKSNAKRGQKALAKIL
jgi:hypothetical protein